VRATRVERSRSCGIAVLGSVANLEGVEVLDTHPAAAGDLGIGVIADSNPRTGHTAKLSMSGVVRDSRSHGVLARGSELDMYAVRRQRDRG
jgi:hypothetical protein